ncbi:MAG: hypothetical protein ACRDRQ_17050 [Pseudonocardiaceae bacterium]
MAGSTMLAHSATRLRPAILRLNTVMSFSVGLSTGGSPASITRSSECCRSVRSSSLREVNSAEDEGEHVANMPLILFERTIYSLSAAISHESRIL